MEADAFAACFGIRYLVPWKLVACGRLLPLSGGHYVESFLKRDFYEVVLLPVESFQVFVSGTEMMCMAITGKELYQICGSFQLSVCIPSVLPSLGVLDAVH